MTAADGRRIAEVDDFIAELWQVHLKVKEEGYVQVLPSLQALPAKIDHERICL